ncbi:hypothetical protein [Leeuwenhoekiella marinoflava]|uniref:hypothetical protein n=1 Tax=Leeuwenhoekiella marinoflava TaxID=988 RepID=UPI003002E285
MRRTKRNFGMSFQLNFFDKVPEIGLTEIQEFKAEKKEPQKIRIIHKPSAMWRDCFKGIYRGAIFELCQPKDVPDINDIENDDVRYNNLIESWETKGVWFNYNGNPEFIMLKNIEFL